MDEGRRKALEAAGFRVGDYAEFLGLTPEERRLVELRAVVATRRARDEAGDRRPDEGPADEPGMRG